MSFPVARGPCCPLASCQSSAGSWAWASGRADRPISSREDVDRNMHYLRCPDDVYRHFATRFEQGRRVIGRVFCSEQDDARYTVDAEGWICRLTERCWVRTIDPLPTQVMRRAEVLTGMRWGFQGLRLADHYPLQQTIRNLRDHVPSDDVTRALAALVSGDAVTIDTWGEGIVEAVLLPQKVSGFEYAVMYDGVVYARVFESGAKFVRTRGRA